MNDANQKSPAQKTNLELSYEAAKLEERIYDIENREEDTARTIEDINHDMRETRLSLSEAIQDRPPATPDRAELYTALVAAQIEIKNAAVNVVNDFTNKKYADLASVMDAVRAPLAKNGLAIIQLTEDPGQGVLGIRTILAHESGQTIEDLITMAPPKLDPQGVGSCRTYMRRYAVLAICGIAGAVDDDAEGANKNPNDYPRISVSEVEKILYTADELFGDHADDAVKLMLEKVFKSEERTVLNIGDIPEGESPPALTYLDNAKKARDKKLAAAKKKEAAEAKAAKEEK